MPFRLGGFGRAESDRAESGRAELDHTKSDTPEPDRVFETVAMFVEPQPVIAPPAHVLATTSAADVARLNDLEAQVAVLTARAGESQASREAALVELDALKMQRLKEAAELDTLRSEGRRLRAQNEELTEALERVDEALRLSSDIVARHRELWTARG